MDTPEQPSAPKDEILTLLEARFGRLYTRQRLGIEADHEARMSRRRQNFFHIKNWYTLGGLVRTGLGVAGLYGRGHRNAHDVRVRENDVRSNRLPGAFDGFTILHVSDMHTDVSQGAMRRLIELLPTLRYDICVLTGDFRGKTFGPFAEAIAGVAAVREHLRGPVYGVLGNHDEIRMVPELEAMGIRMLVNECEAIERGEARIHLAGIDDAHFFRTHNIEKAGDPIPDGEFAVLLSHTPEIYRRAARAGFDLLLSGHTHGGQVCLPGGVPIRLDTNVPRRFGAGAWTWRGMAGYTSTGAGSSIAPVRLNCPPEITLHHLRRG